MAEVIGFQADGTRVPLRFIGDVGNLTWTTGWKNGAAAGCQSASWEMDLPIGWTHPVFKPGRRIEVWDGPTRVFAGELTEPDRDQPWKFTANGLAAQAQEFICLNSTGGMTSILNDAIDQAIARGLPWVRYADLSHLPFTSSSTTVASNKVAALLDAWAQYNGVTWYVWADGIVNWQADPTRPRWLLQPGVAVMGTADDDFVTDLYGRYVTATNSDGSPSAWAIYHASNPDAAARWGRREEVLDLSGYSTLSASWAQQITNAALAKAGARMGFTNAFDATRDQLTDLGGAPARLSQVRAGDMVRCCGVLDSDGNLAVNGTVDIVIGQTDYTDGEDTVKITPVGLVPRTLSDILAAPQPPDSGFAA